MDNSPTGPRTWRPLIMGRSAVASNHPAATQAGLDVLRDGGTAADAAVAVSLCLCIAEPFMSGLGGDGFFHVFDGKSSVYEGAGAAPAAANVDAYRAGMPENGPLAISAPGMLAALGKLHASHGRLPFSRLVEPAVALAKDGVFVGHTYRRYARSDSWRFASNQKAAKVYLADGHVPALGTRIVNTVLGETLEAISRDGIDDFYRGEIADRIAADLSAAGSIVSKADLAATRAETREAIKVAYRGFDILQTPPMSTGFVLLHELAILETFDTQQLLTEPGLLHHVMIEAKKLAFLQRERFGGDPAFNREPLGELFDQDAVAMLASKIRFDAAADLPIVHPHREVNTTYFCVADLDGQVVSAIQSLNAPFGSGVYLPSTGIMMNNRMSCWHLEEGHPNVLAPGKKVRQTMNAPIVLKDGQPWAAVGTPGADNQVQINFQAIVSLIDLGLDPQQTVESPRWSSDQKGQGANWPHGGENVLTVEANYAPDILESLERKGHRLKVVAPLEGPCSLEIIRVLPDGTKIAGSDPRRDGWAAAFG